jgi:preprotein translocase subunit SecD
VQEALVVPGRPKMRITEEYLKQASMGLSETGYCINFTLTDRGGYLMQDLTGRYQPTPDGYFRRLAVILDGSVHSAPTINAPISTSGQIIGDFTEQDLDELVIALNAGRLPALVKLVESQPVGDQK